MRSIHTLVLTLLAVQVLGASLAAQPRPLTPEQRQEAALRQAALRSRQAGDPNGEAVAERKLVDFLLLRGRRTEALQHAERAADLFRATGDFEGLLETLKFLPELRQEAVLRQAVLSSRQGRDFNGEAVAERKLADTLMLRGRKAEALQHLDRALALYHAAADYQAVLQAANALPEERRLAEARWAAAGAQRTGQKPVESAATHAIAEVLLGRRRPAEALKYVDRAIAIRRELRWEMDLANSLGLRGYALMDSGDYRAALSALEEALALFRKSFGPQGGAQTQINMLDPIAGACKALGMTARAEEAAKEAAALRTALPGEPSRRGGTTVQIGKDPVSAAVRALMDRAGDVEPDRPAMLGAYEAAFRRAVELGDVPGQAESIQRMGYMHADMGAYDDSVACSEQAARLYAQAGDIAGQATSTFRAGDAHRRAGRPQEALGAYQRSLDLGRQAGTTDDIGFLVWDEAFTLCASLHRWDLALVYARDWAQGESPDFFQGPHDGRTALLVALLGTGDWVEAEALWAQIQSMCRSGRDEGQIYERNTLGMVASYFEDAGQAWTGIDFMRRRIAAYGQSGDRAMEVMALHALGGFLGRLGLPARALEVVEQAYAFQALAGPVVLDANGLWGMADRHFGAGNLAAAISYGRRSLERARRDGTGFLELHITVGLARFQLAAGHPVEAAALCRSVIRRAHGEFEAPTRMLALNTLGACHIASGHPRDALAPCSLAESGLRWLPPAYRVDVLCNLAAALDAWGRRAEAEARLREAMALIEELRLSLGEQPEARSLILRSGLGAYHHAAWLQVRTGRADQALATVQRAKARGLLELLASSGMRPDAGLAPADRRRIADLRRKVDEANLLILASAGTRGEAERRRVAASEARLARDEKELQTLLDEARARARGTAGSTAPPMSLSRLAAALPKDAALLDYAVLQAGSGRPWLDRTVLLVATADGRRARVSAHVIPVTRAALALRVSGLRAACAERRGSWVGPSRTLYTLLLGPAERRIAGKRRLIICPDGPLWDVPFAALAADSGRASNPGGRPTFLVERFEVVHAYSASCAVAPARAVGPPRPHREVLVVANPDFGPGAAGRVASARSGDPANDVARGMATPAQEFADRSVMADLCVTRGAVMAPLPGAEREARAIHALYPAADVYTGAAAQESTVKREAASHRVLHFATHGFVNESVPMLSCLALAAPATAAEDGFLTAREILDLRAPAELVVLSACSTARGELRQGEGVVGLLWAFYAGGARTVMSAQWSVNDASSAELMRGFYGRMKRGTPKAASLRAACLALLHDRRYAHPYHWAPFILLGDWRAQHTQRSHRRWRSRIASGPARVAPAAAASR